MKHFTSALLSMLVIVAMLTALVPTAPVAAQGGTDADRIQRILDAAQNTDFSSYSQQNFQTTTTNIDLRVAGFGLTITQVSNFQTLANVVIVDNEPNIGMSVSGTVSSTNTFFGDVTSGTALVNADFRYVDNVFYGRINTLSVTGELDQRTDFPQGWFVITSVAPGQDPTLAINGALQGTIFENLDFSIFSNVTNTLGAISILAIPLTDNDDVADFVETGVIVVEQPATLDDGTSVDVITLIIDIDTLLEIGLESLEDLDFDLPEDITLEDLALLLAGVSFEFDFYINNADEVVGTSSRIVLGIETEDITSLLGEDLGDSLDFLQAAATFTISIDNTSLLSNINERFDPVETPPNATTLE